MRENIIPPTSDFCARAGRGVVLAPLEVKKKPASTSRSHDAGQHVTDTPGEHSMHDKASFRHRWKKRQGSHQTQPLKAFWPFILAALLHIYIIRTRHQTRPLLTRLTINTSKTHDVYIICIFTSLRVPCILARSAWNPASTAVTRSFSSPSSTSVYV